MILLYLSLTNQAVADSAGLIIFPFSPFKRPNPFLDNLI